MRSLYLGMVISSLFYANVQQAVPGAPPTASKAYTYPLGTDNPRSTVVNFLEAYRRQDYRIGHVAVLIPNGRVLIVGGNALNCDSQPNPELYDPASGQFIAASPSAFPADSGFSTASVNLLPSGGVLAILVVDADSIVEPRCTILQTEPSLLQPAS